MYRAGGAPRGILAQTCSPAPFTPSPGFNSRTPKTACGSAGWHHELMSKIQEAALHSVELARTATGRYTARNARGAQISFGQGEELLSPVELLLAAIAGCSSIDVDTVTSRSTEPTTFRVKATGRRVVESNSANRLDDLNLSFHLSFPDDAHGRKAAGLVERLIALSHDKYCTVSRTVEHGTVIGHNVSVGIDGTVHNPC